MADMDVEEIPTDVVEVEDDGEDVEVIAEGKNKKGTAREEKKTQVRKPNKHAKEWIRILPGSSNAISENEHVFKDLTSYVKMHNALGLMVLIFFCIFTRTEPRTY